MLKNFLVVTFRNLRRNSVYSIINISGLAVGIVCSFLIMLWVEDETSFDSFLPKYERLYQVWVNAEFDGKINSWRSVPLPTYEEMKVSDSDIINSCVLGWGGDRLLTVGDIRILDRGYFASNEFLEMFEYELKVGDRTTALDDPLSIVITESMAKRLFKDQDPMGEIIKVDDKSSLQVTAILEDIPGNSSFEFEYLIPWKHRESINPWVVENKTNWGNYSFQIFVELNDSEKELKVEETIYGMLTEKEQDDIPRWFYLHPMPRWRLHSTFENGKEAGGRSDYVQLFTIIAIFILVIACINFMNLATARSERRAREVGIRKSLGSNRQLLIFQFLGESVIISLISFLIAVVLTELVLPYYNVLVDKELFIDYTSPQFWIFGCVLVLGSGIISGSYPAFYLSAFKPVRTLKGSIQTGRSATLPRKVLVVLQFGFSILLMISTVVIIQQIELVQNRDLGYDQENLISVEITDDIEENYKIIKQDLLQTGVVEAVTWSNSQITSINSNNFLGWPGKPEELRVLFTTIVGSYDYCKTMGIEILHGRDYSEEYVTDSSAIVINKAALELMGLEEPIIGTNLTLWGEDRKLIGVMDNTLMGSPYRAVKPLFMILDDWGGYVSVRIKSGDLQSNLATIEEVFNKHNPAYPFEYNFADVEFEKKFTTINLTRRLASLFALLALFITGLGLFGLASYTAQRRIKEIGIRKVLGATVASLIGLISKDFTKLVLIAFVMAAPLAWYLLDQYLERYPIRVDIFWWIFPVAGLVCLIFALLIVSNQAGRAARVNPVNSLRNE